MTEQVIDRSVSTKHLPLSWSLYFQGNQGPAKKGGGAEMGINQRCDSMLAEQVDYNYHSNYLKTIIIASLVCDPF